ncbi:hypothetical protein S40288_04505 [Stachybotrys chartarum IBT 40288]|nr:hypothetical protein S40288_04505 [Stachybotrys chartarum IBT 40288]
MLVSKLFNASRLQIWTIWSMAVLNTLLIIACIVVVWARCSPPSAMWTIGGNPDCWDPQINVAIGIAAGVFSAVFDFYLAIYPGIVLWRFPINLKKKIVLSTALGFGFFLNGKFDHLDERYGFLNNLGCELGETLVVAKNDEAYRREYGILPRLEFFTVDGRGGIVPDFFTQETKNQITSWFGDTWMPTSLPERLLDLAVFSGPEAYDYADIKLIATITNQKGSYVSLSHCWVNREVPITTRQNLSQRLARIPYKELSPIFRDAVRVCRFLGVRYLWIDSLCIIQKDLDDWESQAGKMADIYENSFFTLAVQSANEQGFIPKPAVVHEIRPQTEAEARIYVRDLASHPFLNTTGVFFERDGDNPPWIYAHGWCYQERYLSKRILHFAGSEIMYEAGNVVRCQCGNHDALLGKNLEFPESTLHDWKTIVAEYTQRALTQPWDLLPGLAGIARRLWSTHSLGDYVAGLWRN